MYVAPITPPPRGHVKCHWLNEYRESIQLRKHGFSSLHNLTWACYHNEVDTDFASQMKLTKLSLIHCFDCVCLPQTAYIHDRDIFQCPVGALEYSGYNRMLHLFWGTKCVNKKATGLLVEPLQQLIQTLCCVTNTSYSSLWCWIKIPSFTKFCRYKWCHVQSIKSNGLNDQILPFPQAWPFYLWSKGVSQ